MQFHALELAGALKQTMRLTVVTDGVSAALELKDNPSITVILIGGTFESIPSPSRILGKQISSKSMDTMLHPPAVLPKRGLTDFNVYEVERNSWFARPTVGRSS